MFDKGSAIIMLIGLVIMFIGCFVGSVTVHRAPDRVITGAVWTFGLTVFLLGFVWVPLHAL